MSIIRHSTDGRSNVENPISEEGRFGCRIFDIRRMAKRMSKIRHPKKGASDVKYSTFDGGQYRIENWIESFCTSLIPMRLQVQHWGHFPKHIDPTPWKKNPTKACKGVKLRGNVRTVALPYMYLIVLKDTIQLKNTNFH